MTTDEKQSIINLQIRIKNLEDINTELETRVKTLAKESEKFSIAAFNTKSELISLRSRIWYLKDAIDNHGPYPKRHSKIMFRHRKEWPKLWNAIDKILLQYDK